MSPDLEGVSGKYFDAEREATPEPYALDATAAAALWAFSQGLCQVVIERHNGS